MNNVTLETAEGECVWTRAAWICHPNPTHSDREKLRVMLENFQEKKQLSAERTLDYGHMYFVSFSAPWKRGGRGQKSSFSNRFDATVHCMCIESLHRRIRNRVRDSMTHAPVMRCRLSVVFMILSTIGSEINIDFNFDFVVARDAPKLWHRKA